MLAKGLIETPFALANTKPRVTPPDSGPCATQISVSAECCEWYEGLHAVQPKSAIVGYHFRRKLLFAESYAIFMQGQAHDKASLGRATAISPPADRHCLPEPSADHKQRQKSYMAKAATTVPSPPPAPADQRRLPPLHRVQREAPDPSNPARPSAPTMPSEHPLAVASNSRTSVVGQLASKKLAGCPTQHLLALIECEFHVAYLGSPRPLCAMILRWISIVPAPCMCMLSLLNPSIVPSMGAKLDSGVSVPSLPRISIASWAK